MKHQQPLNLAAVTMARWSLADWLATLAGVKSANIPGPATATATVSHCLLCMSVRKFANISSRQIDDNQEANQR